MCRRGTPRRQIVSFLCFGPTPEKTLDRNWGRVFHLHSFLFCYYSISNLRGFFFEVGFPWLRFHVKLRSWKQAAPRCHGDAADGEPSLADVADAGGAARAPAGHRVEGGGADLLQRVGHAGRRRPRGPDHQGKEGRRRARGAALRPFAPSLAFPLQDLHRTGCSLFCGADAEVNQALLKRVLLGYARWNKAVGYCQGFNMLAAIILEVMDKQESDALKVSRGRMKLVLS